MGQVTSYHVRKQMTAKGTERPFIRFWLGVRGRARNENEKNKRHDDDRLVSTNTHIHTPAADHGNPSASQRTPPRPSI